MKRVLHLELNYGKIFVKNWEYLKMKQRGIDSRTILELQKNTDIKAYLAKQDAEKAAQEAEYLSGQNAFKNRFSYDMHERHAANDLLWEIFFYRKSILQKRRGALQESRQNPSSFSGRQSICPDASPAPIPSL